MRAVGCQVILELWGCSHERLDSISTVEQAMREAARACGAAIVDLKVHKFPPIGVTGIAILTESHLAIHTWPEYGYAGVDIFTCGEHADPTEAVSVLRRQFEADHVQVMRLDRGMSVPEEAHGGE